MPRWYCNQSVHGCEMEHQSLYVVCLVQMHRVNNLVRFLTFRVSATTVSVSVTPFNVAEMQTYRYGLISNTTI